MRNNAAYFWLKRSQLKKYRKTNMTEWVNVNSTAIRKIGYEATTMMLYIDFENGDPVYTFCGVPEDVFRNFINSPSKGQFYHQRIKDKFDC